MLAASLSEKALVVVGALSLPVGTAAPQRLSGMEAEKSVSLLLHHVYLNTLRY